MVFFFFVSAATFLPLVAAADTFSLGEAAAPDLRLVLLTSGCSCSSPNDAAVVVVLEDRFDLEGDSSVQIVSCCSREDLVALDLEAVFLFETGEVSLPFFSSSCCKAVVAFEDSTAAVERFDLAVVVDLVFSAASASFLFRDLIAADVVVVVFGGVDTWLAVVVSATALTDLSVTGVE